MKVTTDITSHEQKEREVIVKEATDFAVDLKNSKFTSAGMFCKFEGRVFVPISWVC